MLDRECGAEELVFSTVIGSCFLWKRVSSTPRRCARETHVVWGRGQNPHLTFAARLLRELLAPRRGYLSTVVLVKREHHGEAVSQGQVVPRKVKALTVFVGPDRADTRPDFLAVLVFARVPAMVEDICWCIRH